MRRSCAEIEMAGAASPRSCASMKLATGRVPPRSARRPTSPCVAPGGAACIVARARCRALLAAATLVSSSRRRLAGRPAEHVARDERGPLPGRQHLHRGQERELDRLSLDDDRVGLVVGRRDLVEQPVRVRLQPRHLGERLHRGQPPRRCAADVEADVGRDAVEPRPEQRAAVEASRLRHARRNVSWTASSASSNEASMR